MNQLAGTSEALCENVLSLNSYLNKLEYALSFFFILLM